MKEFKKPLSGESLSREKNKLTIPLRQKDRSNLISILVEGKCDMEDFKNRHEMTVNLMHHCFLEVLKNKYAPLSSDLNDKLKSVFFSDVWGYRETLLVVVIARLLDKNYQAMIDFFKCHPRSLFEVSIRPVLLDFSIPCRASGPLNIAKAANRLDTDWARRQRYSIIAQNLVDFVALSDRMHYDELENFAVNLHAAFLQERDTVVRPKTETSQEQRSSIDVLLLRLKSLPTGPSTAKEYESLLYEMLSYLFQPDLAQGKTQVRTYDNTHIMDIIFLNEAEKLFWHDVRFRYQGTLVLFELKNVKELETEHINQVATYMGRHTGSLAFIVTRNRPSDSIMRKIRAVYNNSNDNPPKTILVLSDTDLEEMIQLKQNGQQTARYIAKIYRDFVATMQ